jgi:hypothetical protein
MLDTFLTVQYTVLGDVESKRGVGRVNNNLENRNSYSNNVASTLFA